MLIQTLTQFKLNYSYKNENIVFRVRFCEQSQLQVHFYKGGQKVMMWGNITLNIIVIFLVTL